MKKSLFILVAFVALFATSCKKEQSKEFVFTPMECDTIEFVIEGLLSEGAYNLFVQELSSSENSQRHAYYTEDGKLTRTVRVPKFKFLEIEDNNEVSMVVMADPEMSKVVVDFNSNTLIEGSDVNKVFVKYQQDIAALGAEVEQLQSTDSPEFDNLMKKKSLKTPIIKYVHFLGLPWWFNG